MQPSSITGVRIIPIYMGKCLFHLRDNKPTITHPNKWSFISGSIEDGESFEDAMKRECKEEIGIIPSNLTYLGHSEVSVCFYAHLTQQEAESMILGEGQEIRFFNPREMAHLDMAPRLKTLVTVYIESLEKLIAGKKVSASDFGLYDIIT